MHTRLVLLAVTVLFTQLAGAVAPENLSAASQQQAAVRETLAKQAADAESALHKWYDSALDAVKKDAVGKGDLDSVVAVDQERARIDRDLTPEEKGALPKLLRTVREQYDQARAQRAAQLKANVTASLRTYLTTLEMLEKNLTQKSDIDGALSVRQERLAVSGQLAGNPPAASAPVASAPPVAPAVPETPAASKPPAAAEARVLEVTGEIKSYGYIKTDLKDALGFETPVGGLVKGRGGRGVLLKREPAAGRHGTTWSFTYARRPPEGGVQIVHPFGTGQVVFHLREEGLFLVPPADFAKTPWAGGDAGKIKLTDAARSVFPLKAGICEVVSQLSAGGQYSLAVNGAVVATATVEGAAPLVLTAGFKGDQGADLPLKWRPGYAALIAGGAENHGDCVCRKVTFQESAPGL